MSNVLEPAEIALRQGNWTLLYQILQHVLIDSPPEQLTGSVSERLLELAIAILESGDFQDRWEVTKLLPTFGDRAIAPLVALLQDDATELEARWFAARMLSRYNQPSVVMTLATLLQSAANEELSTIAAEALATMGRPAIAALTDLLEQADTRLFAVRSLVQIRHADTIAPLLTVATDPHPTIRAIAIEALGSFHDPRVPPVLMQALSDPVAAVRQQAVVGLGMRSDLAEALGLVPLLADRLLDLDLEVCQKAAAALGRMPIEAAAVALSQALRSLQTPLPLRLDIIRALGWMETPSALDSLQHALFSLESTVVFRPVCQEVIAVLGRWTNPVVQGQASQLLITLLTSQPMLTADPELRQAIAVSLGALGQLNAIESLMQLLADEDIRVRLHAIAALKALDAGTAYQQLEVLVERTDVPEALKRGAAIALREW